MSTLNKSFYGNITIYSKELTIDQPTFCPICGFSMRNVDDNFSYKNSKCCCSCELKWVYPNKKAWEDGWRPTQDEINEHIEQILKIPIEHPNFDNI